MSIRNGIVFASITIYGHGMVPGMRLTPRWLNAFASSRTGIPNPLLDTLIAKRLKPRKPAANGGSTDGKKINGRKRHIFVDVEGNILLVCVLPANIHDSEGAYDLLEGIHERYPTIRLIWNQHPYYTPNHLPPNWLRHGWLTICPT